MKKFKKAKKILCCIHQIYKINLEVCRWFENAKVIGNNPMKSQSKYYWSIELPQAEHVSITIDVIKSKKIGLSK